MNGTLPVNVLVTMAWWIGGAAVGESLEKGATVQPREVAEEV